MIPKEIEALLKNAKPLQEPVIKQEITKSCSNCADLIVCWTADKIEDYDDEAEEEAKNIERAKNCRDWHLDFMTYQRMYMEAQKSENEE